MSIKRTTKTELSPIAGMGLTVYLDINDDQLYIQDDNGIRALLADYLPSFSGANIYNSNGTLTGNRILSGGGYDLSFTGIHDFNYTGTNLYSVTAPYIGLNNGTAGILIQPNLIQTNVTTGSFNLYGYHINMIGGDNVNIKSATSNIVINAKTTWDIYKNDGFVYSMPLTTPSQNQVLQAVDNVGTLDWGAANNIYNNDGTLSGDRSVDGANFTIIFDNIRSYSVTFAKIGKIIDSTGNFGIGIGSAIDDSTLTLYSTYRIVANNSGVDNGIYINFNTWEMYFGDWAGQSTATHIEVLPNSNQIVLASVTLRVFSSIGAGGYYLPTVDGTAGQVLTTDGLGNATWQNPSTAGSGFITYDNYSDNKPIGTNGTYVYLDTLGYTNGVGGTAATAFPLTASVFGSDFYDQINSWTIDAVAFNEAHLSMELNGGATEIYSQNNRVYYFDYFGGIKGILLPRYDQRTGMNVVQQFKMYGNNSKIIIGNNINNNNGAVFYRVPNDQNQADNQYLDCSIEIYDFVLYDPFANSATTGIWIEASNSPYFSTIKIINFYDSWRTSFLLGAEFNKCLCTNVRNKGYYNFIGVQYNSADDCVSQFTFISCRATLQNGNTFAWYLVNSDNSSLIRCWCEGNPLDSCMAMVYWSNPSSGSVKNFIVSGFRAEMPCSEAVFFFEGYNMGTAEISSVFNVYAQTLVSLYNPDSSTNVINLRNCNINSNGWNLANSGFNGGAWIFENVYLNGDGAGNFPTTPAQIVDTITFPNIWRTGVSPLTGSLYTLPDPNQPPYRIQIPILRPL